MTPPPPLSDPTGDIVPTVDPQNLLPVDLRHDWAVLPRMSVYQFVLVGALLGAGLALSVVGFVAGPEELRHAFLIALALAWAQSKFLPWPENRLVKELNDRSKS